MQGHTGHMDRRVFFLFLPTGLMCFCMCIRGSHGLAVKSRGMGTDGQKIRRKGWRRNPTRRLQAVVCDKNERRQCRARSLRQLFFPVSLTYSFISCRENAITVNKRPHSKCTWKFWILFCFGFLHQKRVPSLLWPCCQCKRANLSAE